MSLFQLGAVTIVSPGPFNATDTTEEFGSDFGVKPIVGALQDREFDGPSDGRFTITGTLFPFFYERAGQTSGLEEIEILRGMANRGAPQTLMRGSGIAGGGVALGSWLVEKVTQKSTHLATDGRGKVVVYDISLVRSARDPDPADQIITLNTIMAKLESFGSDVSHAISSFVSLGG